MAGEWRGGVEKVKGTKVEKKANYHINKKLGSETFLHNNHFISDEWCTSSAMCIDNIKKDIITQHKILGLVRLF